MSNIPIDLSESLEAANKATETTYQIMDKAMKMANDNTQWEEVKSAMKHAEQEANKALEEMKKVQKNLSSMHIVNRNVAYIERFTKYIPETIIMITYEDKYMNDSIMAENIAVDKTWKTAEKAATKKEEIKKDNGNKKKEIVKNVFVFAANVKESIQSLQKELLKNKPTKQNHGGRRKRSHRKHKHTRRNRRRTHRK